MNTPLHSRRRGPLGRALLVLAALLLGSRPGQAQTVDTYTFAPSAGTYAALPATATAVPGIQADDALSATLPLGFSFVFDGTAYTSCEVSSNGWLTFNTAATGNSYVNDLATGTASERPRVAPYWDDLDGSSGATASYLTTGTAPNRVFTFEWLNWYRYGNTGPGFSMQVQLTEGTNVVRYVYRQEANPTTNASASLGLSGVGAGPGSFLSLSGPTATPTASSTAETNSMATTPATGQIYTFTPAAPSLCPTPRNLAATAISTTSATVSFTVANTSPGPFSILYGPSGFNPALPSSGTNTYATATATGTTATLSGLTTQTAYQFYVRQNCGGTNGSSVFSNAGSFTTNPNPAANDECAQAISLPVATSCTAPANGTTFGATQSLAPSTSCGGTTANDVWYSFGATSNSHTISFAPQFAGVFDVRSGPCATSTSIYCADAIAMGTTSSTIGGLTIGQTYFIRVYTSTTTQPTGPTSAFTLCVVPGPTTPVNDDCAGALNVPIQFGTCVTQTSADNTAATNSTGVPVPSCSANAAKDIWFKVTVPASGAVTVKTLPPNGGSNITDTVMSMYAGTCSGLTEVGCNDDTNGLFSQVALAGRTPGEVLYIRTWAYGAISTGLIAVCATSPSNCAVPTAPTSGNVTNTTATLSWALPTGGLPAGSTYELEYGVQGYVQGTGTTLTGLTAATTTLTGLAPNTAFCYYVRQNCGAANGSSAFVGPTCFTTTLTAPGNDEPCGAVALGTAVLSGSNVGATTSAQNGINLPACSAAQLPKDVWFAFSPTGTSTTLTSTGTAAGMVRVFSSPSCSAGPFTQVFCAAATAANTGFTGPIAVTGLTARTRYYVAVSGFGSSDATGAFTLAGSGLATATKAQADTNALLVFPNPSNTGQLTLSLSGPGGAGQAALLNALGQVVFTKALTGATTQTLSTRGLAAGLYTLRVNVAGQVLTRKVVLE